MKSATPKKASTYRPSPRLDGKPARTRRARMPWPEGILWADTNQAAAYMGVHPDVLRRLRTSGGGPTFSDRLGIAYRREWLDAWMEGGAKTSTSEQK
jgi:hypothetical protein